MDVNRNQIFLGGLIVLLLGVQLRLVDSFVLNERATQFLAQRMQQLQGNPGTSPGDFSTMFAAQGPVGNKRIDIPPWLGYSLLSIGGVLVLYSLALKKPGG
jgi:hypothetical protein